MWSILCNQIFLGILALLITYLVGKIVVSFFEIKGKFFFKLFVTYIIGITTIVLSYSLIKAHGRTVNLLLVPILCYLLYSFKKSFILKPQFDKKEIIREFLWSLVAFALIFSFQSWFYFDFKNETIKTVFGDYYWYSTMCESLKLWGVESRITEMNYFFPEYRTGLLPYHYPELWFTAFFSKLLSNSSFNVFYFSMFTISVTVFLLGISSLFEERIKMPILNIIIGFLLLFTTGFVLPFISVNAHNSWGILDIIGQKLAFIYCFILLSFILIKNKQWEIGLILLATIPIFSITFIPSIWFGLLMFCLIWKIFYFQNAPNKLIAIIFLSVIYLTTSYFLFYTFFKSEYLNEFAIKKIFNSGIFKGFHGVISYSSVKTIFCNFVVYTLPTVFIHIGVRLYLYSVFFILFIKTTIYHKLLFLLILCILFFGAVSSALTIEIFDHDQFIEVLSSLLVVFVIILIATFFSSTKSIVYQFFAFCFLLFLFIQFFSETFRNKKIPSDNDLTFLQSINESIEGECNVVLIFASDHDVKNSPMYHFLTLANDISPLFQISEKTIIPTIANPEKYLKYKRLTYTDSFNYFQLTPITVWRKNRTDQSLESFISRFSIKYCYFKSGMEIPDFIIHHAKKTIEAPKTHNKFIILNSDIL